MWWRQIDSKTEDKVDLADVDLDIYNSNSKLYQTEIKILSEKVQFKRLK